MFGTLHDQILLDKQRSVSKIKVAQELLHGTEAQEVKIETTRLAPSTSCLPCCLPYSSLSAWVSWSPGGRIIVVVEVGSTSIS